MFRVAMAEARRRAGLSQAALGKELGRCQSVISEWELGRSEPPPINVFDMERACGVPPGALSRLLGYVPLEERWGTEDVTSAILADPRLDEAQRRMLVLVFEVMAGDD